MAVLIVPRGETPLYYEFLEITACANRDALIVDRRAADRRQHLCEPATERRHADRRHPPPATWHRDRIIVVER